MNANSAARRRRAPLTTSTPTPSSSSNIPQTPPGWGRPPGVPGAAVAAGGNWAAHGYTPLSVMGQQQQQQQQQQPQPQQQPAMNPRYQPLPTQQQQQQPTHTIPGGHAVADLPPKIPPGTPLTIPQAVQLMELRITSLEQIVKTIQQQPPAADAAIAAAAAAANAATADAGVTDELWDSVHQQAEQIQQQFAKEYDQRFLMFAENIKQLRDIQTETHEQLAKLQQQPAAAAAAATTSAGYTKEQFDQLASEVKVLTSTLMALQQYTMDVNRVLFEERMRLLSEMAAEEQQQQQQQPGEEGGHDEVAEVVTFVNDDAVSSFSINSIAELAAGNDPVVVTSGFYPN